MHAALACALALEPCALLFDEPTSGLDPRAARLLILDQGRTAADGPSASLLADDDPLLRHGLK